MAVTDYDTTAANNTSLNGETVADSTLASKVDDLVRNLMSDTADMVSGNVTGCRFADLAIGTETLAGTNNKLHVGGGDSGVTPAGGTRAFFENNAGCRVEIASGTANSSSLAMSDSNGTDFLIDVDHSSAGETTISCADTIIFTPGGGTDQHLRVTSSGIGFIAFSQASYDLSSATGFGIHATSGTGIFNVQVIGATADTLDVFNVYRGTGKVAAIEANGDFLSATNSYGALSDANLKTNIVDADSQWGNFLSVEFREFDWIESGRPDLGVIAQEIVHVYPELVDEGEDRTKRVNYSGLAVRMGKALQEAMQRIEALERKIAILEAR